MNQRTSQPSALPSSQPSSLPPSQPFAASANRELLDRASPTDYLEYEALTLDDIDGETTARRGRVWPALGLAWIGFGIGATSLLAPRSVARLVPRRFAYVAVGAMAALAVVGSFWAGAGQRTR